MKDRMKNALMLCVVLIMGIGKLGYGQTIQDDPQWYVQEGNISGNLVIKGMQTPNIRCKPNAADDLLIIFKDGSYFNSRPNRINNDINHFRFVGEDLHFKTDKPILYLYATNVYDDDPPPARMTISDSYNQNLQALESISYSGSENHFEANHDIVVGKDITLIYSGKSQPRQLIMKVGNTMLDTAHFELTTVFNGKSAMFGIEPVDISFNQNVFRILKPNNGNFYYINLRAKDSLSTYINENITFIIRDSNNNNSILEEKVRAAHDPNFIRFDASCNKEFWTCLGKESVKYEMYQVHFYNASKVPACSLACRLKLPSHLDLNSIKVMNPIINGNSITSELITKQIIRDSVYIIFPKDSCIKACDSNLPNSGHVDFYLIAKSIEGLNIQNQELSGVTIFDKGTKIEKKYDLLFIGGKNQFYQRYDTISPNCENLPDGFPMCLIIIGATAAAVAASVGLKRLKENRESIKN